MELCGVLFAEVHVCVFIGALSGASLAAALPPGAEEHPDETDMGRLQGTTSPVLPVAFFSTPNSIPIILEFLLLKVLLHLYNVNHSEMYSY